MSSQNGDIQIDIKALKKNTRDALLRHLIHYQNLCICNRETYKNYAKTAKFFHDITSLNSLVVSTILGIITSLGESPRYKYTAMSLSAFLACISGVQRFLAFAEKSENARLIAKGFDKIERDIGQAIMYVNSDAIKIDSRTFTKYVEEIQRNIASVSEQAIQSPPESEDLKKIFLSTKNYETSPTTLNNLLQAAREMSTRNSPANSDDEP
jgi:hypothetical protein